MYVFECVCVCVCVCVCAEPKQYECVFLCKHFPFKNLTFEILFL